MDRTQIVRRKVAYRAKSLRQFVQWAWTWLQWQKDRFEASQF